MNFVEIFKKNNTKIKLKKNKMTFQSNKQKCENNEACGQPLTDFSIDHILNRAGKKKVRSSSCDNFFGCSLNSQTYSRFNQLNLDPSSPDNSSVQFPWLQCTRYCPPKIPRSQKTEGPQKRQMGRHPRIPFTSHQSAVLEERFKQSPYLSSEEVTNLSTRLQLPGVRVKIWFQNRRARERRERNLAEDNSQLKSQSSTESISPVPITDSMENLSIRSEDNSNRGCSQQITDDVEEDGIRNSVKNNSSSVRNSSSVKNSCSIKNSCSVKNSSNIQNSSSVKNSSNAENNSNVKNSSNIKNSSNAKNCSSVRNSSSSGISLRPRVSPIAPSNLFVTSSFFGSSLDHIPGCRYPSGFNPFEDRSTHFSELFSGSNYLN